MSHPLTLSILTRRQTLHLDVTGALSFVGDCSQNINVSMEKASMYRKGNTGWPKLVCTKAIRILLMRIFDL